jgi:hypothetical protein
VAKPGGEGGFALLGRPQQQVEGQPREEHQRRGDEGHSEGDARREEVGLQQGRGRHEGYGEGDGVSQPFGEVVRSEQGSRPEPSGKNSYQQDRGEGLDQVADQTPPRLTGVLEVDSSIAGMYNT